MDYLVAAIQQIFSGSLDNFKSMLENNDSLTYNTLAPSLIYELDAIGEEFILVLDDYGLLP